MIHFPMPLMGMILLNLRSTLTRIASHSAATGMDLYGDDTQAKAQQLASILSQVDVITMATDRLDKSIPRSPARYPLTIHYYQLLFSGQLGFRLAATFDKSSSLFGYYIG